MLYDVLLALFGHTGDIIVESEKNNGKYKVVDEIKLSTSERSAITAILKTGQLYTSVKKFCVEIGIGDYYSDLSVLFVKKGSTNVTNDYVNDTKLNLGTKNFSNSNGYYMIAFCNGIQRYLSDYRRLLLTLEDVATSVKVIPTSTFTIIMRDQNKILHCLQTIILDYQNASNRYDERDMFSKSGDLLEILSEKPKDKSVREIYTKLRRDVLSFLKFQLRNWICSGHLLDPYGEFVIGYRDLKNINQDCQIPLNTLQTNGVSEKNYHSRLLEYEWNYKFYIKLKRGSTFGPIDYKTSKSILFIGKVIRVLSRSLNDFNINRTGLKKNLYSVHLVHLADKHIFDVWNKICMDRDMFQAAVETYRKYVSALFREFVDRNLNIKHQLKLFKDVYLMGYDSIYNSFFEETYDHLSRKYNENSFKLINKEFGKAISVLTRKDEDVNDKFEYLEDTYSGKLEDKDEDTGRLIGNGSSDHVMNKSNLSKSKEFNRMGSSRSAEMNSSWLIDSSEMSSYSHESADMEEMMKNYELDINQMDKIKDEESFEMFKHINDFNINSKFIKINKVKHKYSVILGSNSSIWYEQVVYIMNSFNISLVANLSKINKFKQFSVILSSKYFNSFEDGQKNELDTNNTKVYEKGYSSNSIHHNMYNSDINRGNEKEQKNNVKKYIAIDFKFVNNDGKLKILIKMMYNNIYNNNNMMNKSIMIYSKEQTFKYNSKDKELQVEVELEFNKSNLKVNLKEFREKLNKSMTHYSIEKLYDKSFSGESSYKHYMDEDEDYLSEEDFDDDEEEGIYDSELNKSRLFFKSTKSKSFKNELKSDNIGEKIKMNNINGIKRDNSASIDLESKISEVMEMCIEIKSFDIIELLKLMSDSLYIGIINHTPEGINKVNISNKKIESSSKKVKDSKKNRKVSFNNNNNNSGSSSKQNNTDKGYREVEKNNNSIECDGKTSNRSSDSIDNDTNSTTNYINNITNYINNITNDANNTTYDANNTTYDTNINTNNHTNSNISEDNADDDSIEFLIFDYYAILNRYDLMPYYKERRFIKNSKYSMSIRNITKSYTNEEENLENDIGINEWIYVLLNYKYRYINFVNIKSYNNIFQIIFTVKRCLYGLEKRYIIDNEVRRDFTRYQLSKRATSTTNTNTNGDSDANSAKRKRSYNEYCNLFRKLYAFKYYLQTNLKQILLYFYNGIIEPKYAELESFVEQSRDFQLIKTKHHIYVENILR
ncbi:hypothetical protein MACK_001196 [Theileria orientalis]|uniref:Gamma tubulin complex component protein N-terminal domain-containing protein n=1 Tax=Theileria orientalis TaxID=68886 RepID=A0A976MCM0_THEOR|nr:hypothetical protein MACK_001196 [Theileria orientalis]